jgi:hypothetical protein
MTTHTVPIIPPDRIDDLHHLEYAEDADLILFNLQIMLFPLILGSYIGK